MNYRTVLQAKKEYLEASHEVHLAKLSGKHSQAELDKMYDKVGDLYDYYLECVHEHNYPNKDERYEY